MTSGVISDKQMVPQARLDALLQMYNDGHFGDVIAQAALLTETYASALLYNLVGLSYNQLGDLEDALPFFKEAIKIDPSLAIIHNNIAGTYQELGRPDDAINHYRQAILIDPSFTEAHLNIGRLFNILGKETAGLRHNELSTKLSPDNATAWNNTGMSLFGLGRVRESIAFFERAIEISPQYPGWHLNLAEAFNQLGRYDQSISSYQKAISLAGDHQSDARAMLLMRLANICDWDSMRDHVSFITDMGITDGITYPFPMLAMEDHPQRHLARASRFSAYYHGSGTYLEFNRRPASEKRIRIGYFSSNFQRHPTLYLMIRLFELHNREKFEIFAYSFGHNVGDAMTSRLIDAVDHYRDVKDLGDYEISQLAREDEIDIAIDLNGYTRGSRWGIFASRAAPIQISYLAYPGTSGASFIDYMISDRIVTPDTHRSDFSEKIISLPNCYQANDNTRLIPLATQSRREAGLPEEGFVFCCFNNNYKISPNEFDIWMRLLRRVQGSVLWLYESNSYAQQNLRKQAARRGIDPLRLVFAKYVSPDVHMARYALVDLFLDTFNINAHTTASDALWMSVPIVTKIGEGFAARVCASILNAMEVPELITSSEEEYERVALELALDSHRLASIKRKLAHNRQTAPLFDSLRFTRDFEKAMEAVIDVYDHGGMPQHINIE